MFRGVDCANPSIDFSGRLILGSERAAEVLSATPLARVGGVSVVQKCDDGPEHIDEIVPRPGDVGKSEHVHPISSYLEP